MSLARRVALLDECASFRGKGMMTEDLNARDERGLTPRGVDPHLLDKPDGRLSTAPLQPCATCCSFTSQPDAATSPRNPAASKSPSSFWVPALSSTCKLLPTGSRPSLLPSGIASPSLCSFCSSEPLRWSRVSRCPWRCRPRRQEPGSWQRCSASAFVASSQPGDGPSRGWV